jgi:hypothetical protein
MTQEDVRAILYDLGNSLFPISFQSYLAASGKTLWGLEIDPDHRRFNTMFGELSDEDLERFNKGFHDTIAGYKVSARLVFPSLSADADVFLLAKQALTWSGADLLPIVLHELCHWYLDSGNQAKLPVAITPIDRQKGKTLYKRTDIHNEHVTKHTLSFCEILCAMARRAVEQKKYSGSRDELVASAMRFDIDGGRA